MLTYWQVKLTYRFEDGDKDKIFNFKTKKEAMDFYNLYGAGGAIIPHRPEKQYIVFRNEIRTVEITKYRLTKSGLLKPYRPHRPTNYTILIDFPDSIIGNDNKVADYCKNALKHYNELSNRTRYAYRLILKDEQVFDFRTNKLIPKKDRYYDDGSKEWDSIVEALFRKLNEEPKDADSQEDQEGGGK